ncbi:chromosome segregation ATPase [Streptomyces sp. NPDC056528]|uniref:chromosome segregation ATPase n=1 Tax=Streptomyces sp. NPDC056528 TaxID=3345854 RepID=UPI003689F886
MAGSSSARRKADGTDERPKWVPLREDQHSDLSVLARELMLARSVKAERLTENTVIRLAVDLLVRYPDLLVGDTEEELRTNMFRRFEELLERERELLAPEEGAREGEESQGEGR